MLPHEFLVLADLSQVTIFALTAPATNLGMCVCQLALHCASAARCRPAILPPQAGQVPRSHRAILTSPPAPTLQPPEPAVLCMAVACFRECCQHAPTSRTTARVPSSLSGCQGEEVLSLTKNSSGQRSPLAVCCLAGGQGSLFLLLCFPALGDEPPAPAPRYTSPRFQIPPRGGSAIGVGDINPTQVSFLRE